MRIKDLVPWKSGRGNALSRLEERDPFLMLHDNLHRMFDDVFRTFDRGFGLGRLPFIYDSDFFGGATIPRVNVSESDKDIQVSAELPGMDEKDVEVTLADGVLTIKGEKKLDKEDKDKEYYRMESSYGLFCRNIQLPSGIDTDKVDATFSKGVLTITIPKTEEAKANVKRIDIRKK